MGGVFGKSKKQPSRITDQDKAVLVSKTLRTEHIKVYSSMNYIITAIKTTKR